MWVLLCLGIILILAFFSMLYALLTANDPYRNADQEWEDHLKFLHEYYQKQQRNKITVRNNKR